MGHNWKAIADSFFPGRTALQARNQYNLICRRTGFDTQLSPPGSMQGLATPLPMESHFPHIKPSHTESVRPPLQRLPTDTDFEYEESNDRCGEEEDDDDSDNTGWPQSEEWSQWDPASEFSPMQASQSLTHSDPVSSHGLETLTGPLLDDGMRLSSSFDLTWPDQFGFELGDPLTLQQASNQPFIGDQVWKAPRTCE